MHVLKKWIDLPFTFLFHFLLEYEGDHPSPFKGTKMIMRRHASCLTPKSLGLLSHVRMAIVVFNDCSVPIVAAFSKPKCGLELNKY